MTQTDNEKYIGLVKVVPDNISGTIHHAKLGDLIFPKSSIDQGQALKSFTKNAIVLFIPKQSQGRKNLLKAEKVKHLKTETDIYLLFGHFFSLLTEKGNNTTHNMIQEGVQSRIKYLLKQTNIKVSNALLDIFKKHLTEACKDIKLLKTLLNVTKDFFPNNYKQITETAEKNTSEETAYNLWLEKYFDACPVNYIAKTILTVDGTTQQNIFERCSEEDKRKISPELQKVLQNHIPQIKQDTYLLKEALEISRKFFPERYNVFAEIVEQSINEETACNLWLEKYFDACPINYIAKTILSTDRIIQRKIFDRCSEEDKANIFFKVIYTFENIDTERKLETIKAFLKLSKEFSEGQHEKILSATLNICPEYYKLSLWLDDLNPNLDFHNYKLSTITLSPSDQKRFVKKVLKNIHEGKINLSIDDLTSINTVDYEMSKAASKIDNSYLDYSTSIILNTIQELHNKTKLQNRKDTNEAKHRIYDLIIKQIKEPNDILQITGYFDECEGRCSVSVDGEKNENGKVINRDINYHRNEDKKPKLHPICDGRKAISKKTNEPVLCEKYNVEFWWCANQKCYKPSRQLHTADSWEKYTLLDFLTILKVQFIEKDFEIYLNLINKANHFLKHLKCRKCNHILRPIKQANYAFYGVNEFHCTNEACEEKGNRIYLTHCLNGLCEQAIDSRDCIKCKPDGYDSEKCGWYVCNYCHSCCSDEGVSKRVYILERTGQEYKCHRNGHRNQGIICCNICGNAMESNEYKKVLDWFIANKDISERIYKSGKNKLDKWWFLIKRGNEDYEVFRQRLNKYFQLGFQIPDLQQDKDLQLISEPWDYRQHSSEILTCKFCGNTLDLSSDIEKAWTIKWFHNVRFVKQTTET